MASKSTKVRLPVEALAAGAGIGLVCALLAWSLSSGGSAAAAKPATPQAQATESPVAGSTYEGMVTDTHCGAKHSAAINQSAGDCTRMCVHGGERFALIDGDTVYVLEGGTEALKRTAGQRVRIVGTLNGDTLSVASVRAL
jgi:hypothetical protein